MVSQEYPNGINTVFEKCQSTHSYCVSSEISFTEHEFPANTYSVWPCGGLIVS